MVFESSAKFMGSRPGFVFKMGPQGLGYYADGGSGTLAGAAADGGGSGGATATAANGAVVGSATANGEAAAPGWIGMRTVADLRRSLGIGAPRNSDSLYRPIERAPKVFNPLKVPKALQAALPFKSKPKVEAARRPGARPTLEQRRAVVREAPERKAVTLLQQFNAIRNQKAARRREQAQRKRAEHAKKVAKNEEGLAAHQRAERKKRYIEAAQREAKTERPSKRPKRSREE